MVRFRNHESGLLRRVIDRYGAHVLIRDQSVLGLPLDDGEYLFSVVSGDDEWTPCQPRTADGCEVPQVESYGPHKHHGGGAQQNGFIVALPKGLADMTDEEIDAFVDATADRLYEQLTGDRPLAEPDAEEPTPVDV